MEKLISHRGIFDKNTKENSYEAIKKALVSDNYLGVEFDVRETIDNELIIYHNALYNNKLISKTRYNELPKYVPRLDDILKIDSNKIFLIEFKYINNYDNFLNIINKYCDKNIYIMSFSNRVIEKINKENSCYKIGVLNYILNTSEFTKKLDFVGI
ncbi:MAG: glycerophosphodiester phosphodiesterase, partial [Bacilli bacterium]|nr:glycerophosphodiester phosphodiesterase [Bacilli bacterium]